MKTWHKQRDYQLGTTTLSFYAERDYPGRALFLSVEGHKAQNNNPTCLDVAFGLFGFLVSVGFICGD
jgi:hypothetical protein